MRLSRLIAASTATLLALGLAACSPGSGGAENTENANSSASAGGFPVTIEHVYGTTTIPEQPERVATIAWANHEVPLALGIVPVGMSKAAWGDDDDNGILPWVENSLTDLGGETPVLFDETDGIDFEAVADTQPDVILAAYSGITEEEYTTLSKIAPVVAYPEVAWATSVDDMITMNGAALGKAAEAEQLISDLHTTTEDALAENPGLADARILFSYINPSDLSKIGFYTLHDTRPSFLADLGLPQPAVVTEASEETSEFYTEVSAEAADQFADVDVFVTYGDPDGRFVAQLQADPLLSKIPAIANGNIVILQDSTPLAASANPSPLSIPWGISDYFALLAGGLPTE